MSQKALKLLSTIAILIPAVIFVAIFGGPNILKAYIKNGIGDCAQIPILCKAPNQEIINPEINKEFTAGFLPYKFSRLSLSAPRGFAVIQELEKKPFYKKRMNRHKESLIYSFRQDPEYFIKLFPQTKRMGITDNYGFIKQLALARTDRIKNMDDAFFVILKSIFTPDIGNQDKVVMASFEMPGKRGFISYNLFDKERYFDCNVVSEDGDFYKIYIKDMTARLDLKEAFTIISTLNR